MARIRTIKPEFYRHEGLQDLEIENPGDYPMMVFQGLWSQCDKNGVFPWRPRQLKLDILPFLPFDMATTLSILQKAKYLIRYTVDQNEYGYIQTFSIHQRISGKEAGIEGEKYPLPTLDQLQSWKQPGSNMEAIGKTGEADEKKREIPVAQEKEREKEKEKERIKTCSEPKKKLGSELETVPPIISIPLICKKDGLQLDFGVTQAMIDDWSKSYPAVDVTQELNNIRQWNLANPTRRKTESGIMRHINTWLVDKQNKGGPARFRANPNGVFQPIVSTGEPTLDVSLTNASNFVKKRMEGVQFAE